MRSVPALKLAWLVLLGASCATGGTGRGNDPNRISEAEIAASTLSNAYELVEQLRPRWLISRGDRSQRLETTILVYVDNAMLGDVTALRTIPLQLVASMEALTAAQAGQLPGLGSRHVERAIVVRTFGGIRRERRRAGRQALRARSCGTRANRGTSRPSR
jgi:hypothetical protein